MKYITLLLSGIIFGVGLILSGMTNPLKVQNFLDLIWNMGSKFSFCYGGCDFCCFAGFLVGSKAEKTNF